MSRIEQMSKMQRAIEKGAPAPTAGASFSNDLLCAERHFLETGKLNVYKPDETLPYDAIRYVSESENQDLVDKHKQDMQAIVDEIINNTLIKRNLTQNEQAHLAFDINKLFEDKL